MALFLYRKETSGIFSHFLRSNGLFNILRFSKFPKSGAKPDQHLQRQALWENISRKFHGGKLWLAEIKAAFLHFLPIVWFRLKTQDSESGGWATF